MTIYVNLKKREQLLRAWTTYCRSCFYTTTAEGSSCDQETIGHSRPKIFPIYLALRRNSVLTLPWKTVVAAATTACLGTRSAEPAPVLYLSPI